MSMNRKAVKAFEGEIGDVFADVRESGLCLYIWLASRQ